MTLARFTVAGAHTGAVHAAGVELQTALDWLGGYTGHLRLTRDWRAELEALEPGASVRTHPDARGLIVTRNP